MIGQLFNERTQARSDRHSLASSRAVMAAGENPKITTSRLFMLLVMVIPIHANVARMLSAVGPRCMEDMYDNVEGRVYA